MNGVGCFNNIHELRGISTEHDFNGSTKSLGQPSVSNIPAAGECWVDARHRAGQVGIVC